VSTTSARTESRSPSALRHDVPLALLHVVVIAGALLAFFSGYREYVRRPVHSSDVVAVPSNAWRETGKRARNRAFAELRTKPCRTVEFPPNLLDKLDSMAGSRIRFRVEHGASAPRDCYGWSASFVDTTSPGISEQDVVEENERHALIQMTVSGALALGALGLLLYRKQRAA
jgi:hypothetical protein